MNYKKLLLNELMFVPYVKTDAPLTDELMMKAVTLNENLQSLGYSLSPADLAALAVSPSLDGFYEEIASIMDEVPAAPMYPGFPKQVMEMEEAVFRFHQMVHYFSTYGIELLSGEQVTRGWLPYEDKKSKKDSVLSPQDLVLNAKTLKLIPVEDIYLTPLRMILSRRERMTLSEREMVSYAIGQIAPEEAAGLPIGFKENLNVLYGIVFDLADRRAVWSILRGFCQHTGDVMRCIDILLGQKRFHFRTSEKRFLVKLLENYPVRDFRANLILSGKGARRNILLLQYLDYSCYSRSPEHMAAVDDLRDSKLRSWEGIVKSMLSSGEEGTLDFIVQRPGMMLRMVAWLLRLGYTSEEITDKLEKKAAALSMQTLVTNLNHFGKLLPEERKDADTLYKIFEDLLLARMRSSKTPLRGKRVLLRMEDFNLGVSELHCSDKSQEGGFIRSGIAYRIPEDVNALRFFVYWNDPDRVDVDLHTGFTDLKGHRHQVGWNASFRDSGVVFSGDITHSDAAEYMDIDLTAPISEVYANLHLFSGKDSFKNIETCYVGMMAVPASDVDDQSQELYSEGNCFFHHNLRSDRAVMNYGFVDVQNRCLVFDGSAKQGRNLDWYGNSKHRQGRFSLERYLELLMTAQEATLCEDEKDADVILVMGHAAQEKEISFVENNFFL